MKLKRSIFIFLIPLLFVSWALYAGSAFAETFVGVLTMNHSVGEVEPVLGGTVSFDITLGNTGLDPVSDKGYNVTISNTLPISVTFTEASISPTHIEEQSNGRTVLIWDNISDLEVNEELGLTVYGSLDPRITQSDVLTNTAYAKFNNAPDNSLAWQEVSSEVYVSPQAIDIEAKAIQSTADQQATGAGEYDGNPDWIYQYEVTVKNNNVGETEWVEPSIVLPPGVAYMGNVTIEPNPNDIEEDPRITLNEDGSLMLEWNLETLGTDEYETPVVITFDTAIPYKFRTYLDILAAVGAFGGPMHGDIIPEDELMTVTYEATGRYGEEATADGTTSTADDDKPVKVTAEYLTISKSGPSNKVGIGDTVVFNIDYFVSEYYTTTNVIIEDILPDGMTYVDASLFPSNVETDTPADGQTTITFDIPSLETLPGATGTIILTATVDATYEQAPYAGEPIVAGDSLTNQSTLANDYIDVVTDGRADTGVPDASSATVSTQEPTLTKDVKDPETETWGDLSYGFSGDTIYFRINYTHAENVDGKEVVIRDYLPRGMTFVSDTDSYSTTGSFTSNSSCTTNVSSPTLGTLNGLQYLEWKLCNVTQDSTWETEFGAILSDDSDVQADWIVANMGKLSYQNTFADGFSQRDSANVEYRSPELIIAKSANPAEELDGTSEVTYSIVITNSGKAPAYNLNLLDTLPEWLKVNATGGSSTPGSSTYTADSSAQAGNGGIMTWSQITSLAPGETQSFTYDSTLKAGAAPGIELTNMASVAHNSRSDNTGREWLHTVDPTDNHTITNTVYVKGLKIQKTFSPNKITIGDIVTWTLDVTVPPNLHAHYPVVEENNLPTGFDYLPGTTVITGGVALSTDHAENPLDNGNRDIRWFLDPIDNSSSGTDYNFTIEFQTLFTGVNGKKINKEYFTDNCKNYNRVNKSFVGWYESADGHNNTGQADTRVNTQYDYRSAVGKAKIKLQQPCLSITNTNQFTYINAGGIFYYELVVENTGDKPAYDVEIDNSLPMSITFRSTQGITVTGSPVLTTITDDNTGGDSNLTFGFEEIPANSSATIRYYVDIDPNASASLELVNSATIAEYSTQAGVPADINSDTLTDERVYVGPTASNIVYTPRPSIHIESKSPEGFTHGSTIFYTITVPTNPTKASFYESTILSPLPDGLVPVSTSMGSFDGNVLTVEFDEIEALTQEVITIEALVPLTSPLKTGNEVRNAALLTTDLDNASSNATSDIVTAPALVVDKVTESFLVVAGDEIEYTLYVRNVGGGKAFNIDVTDVLPENQSYLNGEDGVWFIEELDGYSSAVFTYTTRVDYAIQGVGYTGSAYASNGVDFRDQLIPSDNSARVAEDTDPLDLGKATVYSGPLVCNSEIKNVAFEDLKNAGWSDWDYNDLIVKVETELCFTPSTRSPLTATAANSCSDVSIEAEDAVLNGFVVVTDAAASGGSYIHIPDTPGAFDPADPDAATSATFTFNAAIPGSYKFTGIAEGISVFGDSFWFKVDDNDPIQWAVPRDSGLTEDDVADFVNDVDPYSVNLTAGDHTITIYNREDGARLDKLTMVCEGASETYEPDTLATATITYTAGARGAAFNHSLKHNLDVNGGGQAHWVLYDANDNILEDVWSNFGDDADFTILPDTHEALPPYHASVYDAQTNTRKDQPVYTEGYRAVLQISLHDAGANPKDSLQELPWDVYLPVKDTGEEIHLLVPGHLDNMQTVSLDFDGNEGSPLLGQSLPFGFSFEDGWHWPTEFSGVWKAYPEFVDFIESGRSAYPDWYQLDKSVPWFIWETHYGTDVPFDLWYQDTVTRRYQGGPVVADLDLDGMPEIILGDMLAKDVMVMTGGQTVLWTAETGGGIRGSVAVGNLDADDELEVVALAEDGLLYGWNHDGSDMTGFPIQIIDGRLISTPVLEDIDQDGTLEILISASNGRLYVRNADGSAKWNASVGDIVDSFGSQSLNSSPAVGDLDNDEDLEIVVGGYDTCMHAFDHTGTALWKTCTGDAIVSTPLVAEFALDSPGKEVIFGSGDQYIYVLTQDGTVYSKRETGWIVQASATIVDIDGDGYKDVLIGSDDDKLHAFHFWGETVEGWPQATEGDIVGKATIGDIDGDGDDEILVGSNDATVYAFEFSGEAVDIDWPQKTEASVMGTPVIANVDTDSDLEVIAADFKGNVYVWGASADMKMLFLPAITR